MNTNSYFTIQVLKAGNVYFQLANSTDESIPATFYYWVNSVPNAARDNYDGSITTSGTAQYIQLNGSNNLPVGTIIRLYRAETTRLSIEADSGWYNRLWGSAETKISGNMASLIGFSETIPTYCFRYFFYGSNIVDASELELPWTTLTEYCFIRLFMNSQKLVNPPYLPATTLANSCYTYMFRSCAALKTIAKMGVNTVTCNNAFAEMYALTGIETVIIPKLHFNNGRMTGFMRNCTSLKTVTVDTYNETLPNNAYQHLFRGCTGLETITCKAKSFSSNAWADWLLDASATGTFIKDKDATWPEGNSGIPSGWTIKNANQNTQFLDFSSADRIMYNGNNHIKCIYGPNNQLLWTEEEYFTISFPYNTATVGIQSYGENAPSITLYYWRNVEPNAARDNYTGTITANSSGQYVNASAGDVFKFYRPETTSWGVDYNNYVKFRLSRCDIYGDIASLFGYSSTIPEYGCYRMFYFESVVDASGLILPWNTLSNSCYYGMFLGCSSLINPPVLTATTLADSCYRTMFRQCNSLINIAPMYVKDLSGSNAFYCMYQLCNGFTNITVPAFKSYGTGALGGMFWGCTNLVKATVLTPDEVKVSNAFSQLFQGCSNLSDVTCTIKSFNSNTFNNWLNATAASGTFTKAAGVTWASGVNGIPTGWTVVQV